MRQASESSRDELPSITVAVPTLNEEANLERCLASLLDQEYPHERIELMVVDGGSQDKTLDIARKYGARILLENRKDADYAKLIALLEAKGTLFICLDADAKLTRKDWLLQMALPLMKHEDVVGSFTRLIGNPNSSLMRYLSHDLLQRDPLLRFLSLKSSFVAIERHCEYDICIFRPNATPPVGIVMYRRKDLLCFVDRMKKIDMLADVDIPRLLARTGHNKFAYVNVGLYHEHANSVRTLIRKRVRNLRKSYLPNLQQRTFRWVDYDFGGLLKFLGWLCLVNSIVPLTIVGVAKSVLHKDLSLIYEPLTGLLVTDAILFTLVANKETRSLIGKCLTRAIRSPSN